MAVECSSLVRWIRVCNVTPQREQPDCSSLRALRDHRFIVGPQRAKRMVRLLPFPSFQGRALREHRRSSGSISSFPPPPRVEDVSSSG